MNAQKRTYGVLLRVYTPKPEEVEGRVERAIKHIRQILAVSKEFPALRRVMILVPLDHDCKQTCQALLDRLELDGLSDHVEVYMPPGYHSCEVLNWGLAELSTNISHALIVSGKAVQYLTRDAMLAIDKAFDGGAKVAGLAVDELRCMVLDGRIQNTFATWDIRALIQSGKFDSMVDVEEIAVLIRLARTFGKCIAPIDVVSDSLDLHGTPTSRKRHEDVMRMKTGKQREECTRLGADFGFIQRSVMD